MKKIIVFRDLKKENLHGYEIHTWDSNTLVVKPMTLPAAFGQPPLYVRHIVASVGLIVVVTDRDLTPDRIQEIEKGAIELVLSPSNN